MVREKGQLGLGSSVGLNSSLKLLCSPHEISLQSLQSERVSHEGSLCATISGKVGQRDRDCDYCGSRAPGI